MCTGPVVATCINSHSNDHDSNFCSCETTLFIIAPLIDGRIDAEATNQSSCIRTYSRTTPELWIIESFYSLFCSGSSEVHVICSIYIVGGTRPEVYPEVVVLNGAATAGNSCVDVMLMTAALSLHPAERDVAAIRWHLNRLVDVVDTRRPTYSQLPCHCILHSCHSPGREVRNESGDH